MQLYSVQVNSVNSKNMIQRCSVVLLYVPLIVHSIDIIRLKTVKARNYNPAINETLVYVLNMIWRIYPQWLFKLLILI